MRLTSVFILGLLGLLSGCSTVNSHFSCDQTAIDRCMTIEQVNRMTSFADDYNRASYQSKPDSKWRKLQKSHTDNKEGGGLVWLSPWKDSNGVAHSAQVIKTHQAKV